MDFRFLNKLPSPPFLRFLPSIPNGEPESNPISVAVSPPPPPEKPSHLENFAFFDLKQLTRSLQSFIPPPRRAGPAAPPALAASAAAWRSESGCSVPLFRPYVAKVPWHGGVRAFLSQLFPRYGHYCGPNWSSGKDGGSLLWDRRPIDWLDFCCYCHDIGYDTHDQAKLLKADMAFLECLEKPRMADKGDARVALLYRSMCIAGLKTLIIPYRMQLVKAQEGQSVIDLMSNLISKNSTCRQS